MHCWSEEENPQFFPFFQISNKRTRFTSPMNTMNYAAKMLTLLRATSPTDDNKIRSLNTYWKFGAIWWNANDIIRILMNVRNDNFILSVGQSRENALNSWWGGGITNCEDSISIDTTDEKEFIDVSSCLR